MFTRGDFVWGKMKSFPWWPAIVIHPEDCGRDRKTIDELWLFWFGDHKVSDLKGIHTVNFEENFAERTKNMSPSLKNAVQEILSVSAEQHQAQYTDFASLLSWANSGFKSFLKDSCNRKRKITELPSLVSKALQSDKFKRRYENNEEPENEIDDILKDVRKGFKTLEDICIVCCQSEVKIVMQHPLFVGGVCQSCKKCISKVTKMQAGKTHDMCVVCGQGGSIVYCSSKMCLRSYCKLCIEYLASRESYLEILQNDDWRCWLCSNKHNFKCLIKRREFYLAKSDPSPSLPSQKLPIRVIAQNDAALSVLKRKQIAFEIYCTEPTYPSSAKHLQFYRDFKEKDFGDICANLICGSFLPSTDFQDQRHCLNSFATSFFRFLFRLDNAKLYSNSVFFIFISEADLLDAESLSRVLRFLRVIPLSVELRDKKFFVWCNIPHSSFKENYKFLKREIQEGIPDEEIILFKLMEPLKDYFQ